MYVLEIKSWMGSGGFCVRIWKLVEVSVLCEVIVYGYYSIFNFVMFFEDFNFFLCYNCIEVGIIFRYYLLGESDWLLMFNLCYIGFCMEDYIFSVEGELFGMEKVFG